MNLAAIEPTVTFPEDWRAKVPDGAPFTLDAMHFPFPISPLYASSDTDGFLIALREYRIPVTSAGSVFRNHYRFGRVEFAVPANEAEAATLYGPAEEILKKEIGRQMERWQGEHLPRIQEHLARLAALDPDLDHLRPALAEVRSIATELWTIHFRIVIPMTLAMQVFDEFYADVFGGSDTDAHALLVGQLTESIKAGFGLSDLAREAVRSGLDRDIADTAPDALRASLDQSEAGRAYLARVEEYLDAYGDRQDLFDFVTPTWKEDPSFALATIRNYVVTGRDLREEFAVMAASAEAATDRARAQLATYPEPVREQFEALLQFSRHAMFLQEEHNFHIDQRGTAQFRYFYLRVGKRLVEAGLIDRADDVMMLTTHELREIASVPDRPRLATSLREKVTVRRRELEEAKLMTPPAYLGEVPPAPPELTNPMMRGVARFWGVPPEPSDNPSEVRGMAGSRGKVTGVARVARTLEEARSLQPGEILVAITTMPPWTPLFGVAAAVVTETGGPLSHCAIVAREYGIPAVVGAPGATSRIMTGQLVTVDGGAGLVTIDVEESLV